MTKETFIEKKQNLINTVITILSKEDASREDRIALNTLLELLNGYSYENRLQKKGLLSHTIIDSLELDYTLGEKFIKFDNDIH